MTKTPGKAFVMWSSYGSSRRFANALHANPFAALNVSL